jgi:hypothetical protein
MLKAEKFPEDDDAAWTVETGAINGAMIGFLWEKSRSLKSRSSKNIFFGNRGKKMALLKIIERREKSGMI